MTHCRYHCRGCGGHFTSLEAFDLHRDGPYDARECAYPVDLAEHEGVCATVSPTRSGVTVYSSPRADRAGNYFRAENGAHTAPAKRSGAVW